VKRGEDATRTNQLQGRQMKAVVALASFILILVMGTVGGWFWLFGPSQGSSTDAVPVNVGVLRLNIPGTYMRGGNLARSGSVERVDVIARFPEMTGAGIAPAKTADIANHQPLTLVFVSVIRGDGGLDPADRPQEIYGRFLEPDTWQNPGGLVLRRFAPSSPYSDEELYLAPPDGRLFWARCRRAQAQPSVLGETCLWRYRLSDQDVQVRFAPELLPQWEQLSEGVRQLVGGWVAP
jgi:hypothetical protein